MANRESKSHFKARVQKTTGVLYENIPWVLYEDLDKMCCLGPVVARRSDVLVFGAYEYSLDKDGFEVWEDFIKVKLSC
jgi:hypothetical protein